MYVSFDFVLIHFSSLLIIIIQIIIHINVGFQQQAGLDNKADQEQQEASTQDESVLTKEQGMV